MAKEGRGARAFFKENPVNSKGADVGKLDKF